MDIEGYELNAIQGAAQTLKHTAFVIAEVSMRNRFEQGYRFADVVAVLKELDFELIDVLTSHPMPAHVDCLFVPRHSHLFDRK